MEPLPHSDLFHFTLINLHVFSYKKKEEEERGRREKEGSTLLFSLGVGGTNMFLVLLSPPPFIAF